MSVNNSNQENQIFGMTLGADKRKLRSGRLVIRIAAGRGRSRAEEFRSGCARAGPRRSSGRWPRGSGGTEKAGFASGLDGRG
jgi:hypothetical protein